MRACMRDQFTYFGIPTPQRRLAARPLLERLPGDGADKLLAQAWMLWELPQREYYYARHDYMDEALIHENMWKRRIALLH
jgi:3-methyladenine DNA glycosylase AlkD